MQFNEKYLGDGLDPKEHKALYDAIVESSPKNVFEIGTRKGGGSTLYILQALRKLNKGTLHTVEIKPEAYNDAVQLYKKKFPGLLPFGKFYLGKSTDVFGKILEKMDKVDFLFLDGEENPDSTMVEYDLFRNKFKKGSRLACHDWKISKMKKLKPVLLEDSGWKQLLLISSTLTGFALFERIV
jgi:tRNA A58 N-methylase Trm61